MSKRRRRKTPNNTTSYNRARDTQQGTQTTTTARANMARRRAGASRTDTTQGMIMPAFVALGCWGLAVSFIFFFPDPNHLLYGGMAAAMGLIWSIIVGLRVKRALQMRRDGRIYQ